MYFCPEGIGLNSDHYSFNPCVPVHQIKRMICVGLDFDSNSCQESNKANCLLLEGTDTWRVFLYECACGPYRVEYSLHVSNLSVFELNNKSQFVLVVSHVVLNV